VGQCVDGLRTNYYRDHGHRQLDHLWLGLAVHSSEGLDEACVPFFGAFGAAWDEAMVARWSANPLGMLWPEMGAAFLARAAEMGATGRGAAAGRRHRCKLGRRGLPPKFDVANDRG
jgi:hypothetical protein